MFFFVIVSLIVLCFVLFLVCESRKTNAAQDEASILIIVSDQSAF